MRARSFTSKQEAIAFDADVKARKYRGETLPRAHRETIAEAFDEWWRLRGSTKAPATQRTYLAAWSPHVRGRFDHHDIHELVSNPQLLDELVADMRERGVGNAAQRKVLVVLSAVLYAEGAAPVSAELVFHGVVLPADAPFGGDLSTDVPLVPTLPEAPDAILAKFATTLGPERITYWEYSQGRYIPYHPRGIQLPPRCPHGGFPFAAAFTFENGVHASARAAVPCPGNHLRARSTPKP
jgi:hypothetical protein